MKFKIFAAFAAVVVVATGCVNTVSGTKSPAIWFGRDSLDGRYQVPMDKAYQATVTAINTVGVLVTEYVPHDTSNSVRAVYGRVNNRNVWVRVEEQEPNLTWITVQARTKIGGTDVELAHEVEKQIALQLQSSQ